MLVLLQDKIDVTVLREMLDSIRREGNEGALTVRSLRYNYGFDFLSTGRTIDVAKNTTSLLVGNCCQLCIISLAFW